MGWKMLSGPAFVRGLDGFMITGTMTSDEEMGLCVGRRCTQGEISSGENCNSIDTDMDQNTKVGPFY